MWGGATVIAWDLAYSKKGWLVIEGNDVGEPYLLQAPLQVGMKSTLIRLLDLYGSSQILVQSPNFYMKEQYF